MGAPRVCGDDPIGERDVFFAFPVLPAYAGMIPLPMMWPGSPCLCSPRMRG